MYILAFSLAISFFGVFACFFSREKTMMVIFYILSLTFVAYVVVFYLSILTRISVMHNAELKFHPNNFAAGVLAYKNAIFFPRVAILILFLSQSFLLFSKPKK